MFQVPPAASIRPASETRFPGIEAVAVGLFRERVLPLEPPLTLSTVSKRCLFVGVFKETKRSLEGTTSGLGGQGACGIVGTSRVG